MHSERFHGIDRRRCLLTFDACVCLQLTGSCRRMARATRRRRVLLNILAMKTRAYSRVACLERSTIDHGSPMGRTLVLRGLLRSQRWLKAVISLLSTAALPGQATFHFVISLWASPCDSLRPTSPSHVQPLKFPYPLVSTCLSFFKA